MIDKNTSKYAAHNEFHYLQLYPKLKDIFEQYQKGTFTKELFVKAIKPYTFENDEEYKTCFVLLHQLLFESGVAGNLYNINKFNIYQTLKQTNATFLFEDGTLLINYLLDKKLFTTMTDNKQIPIIENVLPKNRILRFCIFVRGKI